MTVRNPLNLLNASVAATGLLFGTSACKTRIKSEYQADKSGCAALSDKNVARADAAADKRAAELKVSPPPTPGAGQSADHAMRRGAGLS
jgi:hypothetical protein